MGVSPGGSGGEGGLIKAVYGFADLGKTFDDSNLSNTFNAYTINEIWKLAKEGGMNTDKLWQELGKNDPTKKIHISHLPDNKFVTLDTEQTVTASKIFTGQLSTANVVPRVNNASTLGFESKRWKNIYAVDANISGTVKTQALQVGDIKIIYDSVNKAVTFEHIDGSTEIGFYTRGWISALGVSPGGSGGSGGGSGGVNTVYSFANLTDGTTFSDSDLDNTFNAYTIKKLYDMAGQGGLDADAMWAELKKADSSKIIDASHIPTSVLDGRWVTLSTNQTITGQKTFTQNILFSNKITGIRNTAGNLVFGVGNENILCILNDYVGPVEAKNNQLVLGNDAGYWKNVTAGQYISKVATGVSPLIVSSNTLVNNLNADLLDGYHQSSFLRADGVNQYVTLYGGDGNNEGYRLVFEGTVTDGWSVNNMTLLVNSRHAGTGMISIVFHTTNQESTSYVGSLNYYGSIIALGYTVWRLFYNTTTKKVRLFWRFYDYSDCKVSILNSRGLTTNISNKTWYTTIPSDSGSELPSYYNRSDTTGSLATSRTLWGQPFNGTANVSGDMTGVGSINMSGQLTSTVASGVAPFIVVSNTVVGNLNADMVDGLHENSFLRHRDTCGIDGYNTLWSQIGIRQYNNAKPDGMANPIYDYGAVISLPGKNTRLDIWYNHTSSASDSPTNGIQYRSGFNDDKRPWRMLLDSVNYASYSDGRYVKKAGDTMTGDLNISGGHILYMVQTSPTSTQQIRLQGGSNDYGRIAFGATGSNAGWMEIASSDDGNEPIYARQYTGVFTTVKNTLTLLDANGDTVMSNNKGLSVGWGSRQVREGGSWVHGGADAANSNDANLRFGSWMGIGWYPTISGQTVAQGKNAMWLNTRTGVLNVVGGIKESTICIGRVNSSGDYDIAYNGEINRYDNHLYLQYHSEKHLIMCIGGGLAGIGTNSPGEKLHVAGNTRTDGYFKSTVGTGTAPYQCSSTTLNTNLNADMLDNWHLNFLPRNYNNARTYSVQFALGGTDNNWRKIFACSESGAGPYRSVTVWGQIWYAYGNHAQEEVRYYHFCAIFQMRTGPSASNSNVGDVSNSARLYLPTFAKGMDNIRLVRVGTNNFELQVRQINSYHNGHIQYQYWANGANVSAWEKLQSTSNTSVAVSAGGASTLADSRASSADVLTTSRTLWGRPFNGTANVSGDMTGVGSINMSGQLTSTVASGVAPFIVVSNTVVGNLNADMVDGLHENSFLRHRDTCGIDGYNTLWSQIGIRQYNNAKPDGMANPIYDYGAVISLPGKNTRLDIWYNHTSSASDSPTNGIQYRSGFNDDKRPWRMLLDSVNYASYSDGRYVKKAGDTMTGDLNISGGHILYMVQTSPTSTQQIRLQGGSNDYGRIAFGATGSNAGWMEIASSDDGNEPIYARQYTGVFTTVKNTLTLLDANGDTVMSNNKGLSVGWGSRQVREGGSWVHGGADAANSNDANLRFGSWMGIGWYPTISGQTVAQGKNAMWLNTRTGVLNVVGGIKESTICIGRVNSSGDYDIAYNGEINRYDNHLYLQYHSEKHLIMCIGGGLAGIGTNSPGEKLHVAGNTRTDGYFKSTVGTGTAPYQCSSTTLNTNLNADMLDNWHLNFLPRNYNNARTYSVQFALGGTDNNWRKIFACSESGAGPYRSVTVWGQIWYAYGNHAQEEVRYYHFCAIFQMRTGPSASNSNVGDVSNSARLYLPTFAKGMDNIRLVRVGTNNFELQVRQINSYHNGHIQYQYWANGANVSAWEKLQSTSNTSVAVSAGGASTLADSRASSADVLTASRTLWGRPFNGSANIDGNIDNAAVITSKGGIRLDLKGSSGVAFYAGGSLCAVMNTTGVGIGTSSPSQKLHVAGNIIATGAITAKASSSDIRLKTDIQGYDAMGIIRKFRSVKYHWNNLAKRNSEIFNHKKWNYGLIAQDLLSGGYSQWVSDIFKDYYTIDYERLIPVVWKGLQEVDDEVTRLKKRVKELEKRLGINN